MMPSIDPRGRASSWSDIFLAWDTFVILLFYIMMLALFAPFLMEAVGRIAPAGGDVALYVATIVGIVVAVGGTLSVRYLKFISQAATAN